MRFKVRQRPNKVNEMLERKAAKRLKKVMKKRITYAKPGTFGTIWPEEVSHGKS